MNPITFNDSFGEAFEAVVRARAGQIKPEGAEALKAGLWKAAPLFVHQTSGKHIRELYANTELTSLPVMPFPCFRLHLTASYPDCREVLKSIVWQGTDNPDEIIMLVEPLEAHGGKVQKHWRTIFLLRIVNEKNDKDFSYGVTLISHGTVRSMLDVPEHMKADLQKLISIIIRHTLSFGLDCMEPNTHMATVHPADERRSVEWVKARTHYTLITHGHPANRKEVQEGERVKGDATGELTRMAHNRRAHYKTLKHERFRFARGKRIFVKATWIGPKEWADEGGKQIYKILEPVTEEEIAA